MMSFELLHKSNLPITKLATHAKALPNRSTKEIQVDNFSQSA